MLIDWKDVESDIKASDLSTLLAACDFLTASGLLIDSIQSPSIWMTASCDAGIRNHLAQSSSELGGLLLGELYELPYRTRHGYTHITKITHSIPSSDYKSSPVSLRMQTEIWSKARESIDNGLRVIGWYHSHPNLGAFFSGTDRATQAAFFNMPYSVGIVIDTIRNERRCFFGPHSIEAELKPGSHTISTEVRREK